MANLERFEFPIFIASIVSNDTNYAIEMAIEAWPSIGIGSKEEEKPREIFLLNSLFKRQVFFILCCCHCCRCPTEKEAIGKFSSLQCILKLKSQFAASFSPPSPQALNLLLTNYFVMVINRTYIQYKAWMEDKISLIIR